MDTRSHTFGHVQAAPPTWWGAATVEAAAAWVVVRRVATMVFVIVSFFVVAVGPGQAAEPLAPTTRLDCEHAAQGCAGMNGDFASPDGADITSVTIEVRDVATDAVHDVTASGCRLRAQAENASTTRVHCMVEGAKLGIDGDITWSVTVNGSPVWTSPATPTRCEIAEDEPAPEEEPAPGPDVSTPPVEPGTEEPSPVPDGPSEPGVEPQPVVATPPVKSGPPAPEVLVWGDVTPAVRPVQTLASSTPPVYTVRPNTQPVRSAVSAVGQETLPETGVSLGVLAATGVLLLAAGMILERRTRPARLA